MKKLANLSNQIRFIEDFEECVLENRNYIFKFDPDIGYFLSEFKNFALPEKLYDEETLNNRTNRIKACFDKTKKNLGVLLSGLKGTGKSVQMKHIAANSGMPVIVIDTAYSGSDILAFLNDLGQQCVVLIDEFEKIYVGDTQNEMLPLLDGIASSSHIFVLTTNSSVSQYLNGRPSRVRYNIKYKGLPKNLIEEIVDDNLKVTDKKDRLIQSLSMIKDINIDTILSLINEINNFPDMSYEDVVGIFNLEDPLSGEFDFFVSYYAISHKKLNEKQYEKLNDFLNKNNEINLADLYLQQLTTPKETDLKTICDKLNDVVGINVFSVHLHIRKIYHYSKMKDICVRLRSAKHLDIIHTYLTEVPFDEEVLQDIHGFSLSNVEFNIGMENNNIFLDTGFCKVLCKPVVNYTPNISM